MKGKEGLEKKIKRALDINELLPDRDMLRLLGMRELSVRECESILFYSKEQIKLAMREYLLTVSGKEMLCTSYSGRVVCVEGEIYSLALEKRGG